jgi:hypothetical protein
MARIKWQGILIFLGCLLFAPYRAWAHCDGMDGPVVKAAHGHYAKAAEAGPATEEPTRNPQ